MFYSIHEISIMTKGHTEEIKRSCNMCSRKKTTKEFYYKKILNYTLTSLINIFNK